MLLRRWCLPCAVLTGMFSVRALAQNAPAAPKEQLVGAWKLVSIETVRPNGEVMYPYYGKHPNGLIVYAKSGWMSVQIVSDPPASVPSGSSREAVMGAPAVDKAKAFENYYAYFGTWTLDPPKHTVTHHILHSLSPGEVGEDAVRQYVLDGDRLVLTAKAHEMGEDHERKLVWQRVSEPPSGK